VFVTHLNARVLSNRSCEILTANTIGLLDIVSVMAVHCEILLTKLLVIHKSNSVFICQVLLIMKMAI